MTANWQGKRVLIIGAARQGLALARYLAGHGAAVTINDQRAPEQMTAAVESLAGLPITWALGGHPLDLLDRTDLVCLSGGVPLTLPIVQEAARRGLPLSNDSQVFMDLVPCPVVGITGSAGKTTTTTLVSRMAEAHAASGAVSKAWVGGNIGNPLITSVDEMTPSDLVVLELSSFQLEQMTTSPQVAAILNITPNHLDRHGTMEAYTAAKARILDFQAPADVAVLGRDDPGAWALRDRVQGKLLSFGLTPLTGDEDGTFLEGSTLMLRRAGQTQAIMPRSLIRLPGLHNLNNVLAACAIAAAAGMTTESMRAGVDGFLGVAHRLQFVRTYKGADWYNGSIATAPERTMADIRSFEQPLVLLVGGRDKKLPWEDFAALARQRVDHLVVFGEAAGKILKAVGEEKPGERPYTIRRCTGLREAVWAAADVAEPGDVVLLSPGGTSFDEFTDFEERGECFQKWVKELL